MLALLTLCLTQIGQVQVPHPRLELSAPSSFETNPVHQPWGCWLNRRPGHLSTDPMWLPLSEKFQQQPRNLSDCLRWQKKCCHMLIYSGPDVILHHSWNYIYRAVNNVPANVCFFFKPVPVHCVLGSLVLLASPMEMKLVEGVRTTQGSTRDAGSIRLIHSKFHCKIEHYVCETNWWAIFPYMCGHYSPEFPSGQPCSQLRTWSQNNQQT